MYTNIRLAFDRTARHVDTDGRMHIERSHISKAAVNPYYGKEIPRSSELGLEPDKIYRLFRDPVELERGAATFARLPILSEHIPVSAESIPKDKIVGALGSDVAFKMPYLDADLCFWDAAAIAGIETDKVRELSCSYHYEAVMEPGEFEGQPYDGRMTHIRGNHLAIVEVGRAGSDVIVADHNPFHKESAMKKQTKLGKALLAALCAISPVLAADSAMPALLGSAARKSFRKKEVVAKLLAADAELNPEQLDRVLDAILDVEQEPDAVEPQTMGAADESPADKLRKLLAGKVDDSVIDEACSLMMPAATDEFPPKEGEEDKGMKPDEVKAAMDSLRKELRDAEEARRDVRAVVGDVLGQDSAEDIYGFALNQMKVEHKGVSGVAALRALYKVAASHVEKAPARLAHDSVGLTSVFPGADRFRNV